MKDRYSYFEDELAITEIRKHKWIESEKLGEEIGFASAALDWIQRHGYAWQQYRLGLTNPTNNLSERRQHRRFKLRFPVQLSLNGKNFNTHTEDISLIGFACMVPQSLPTNSQFKVTIRFLKVGLSIPMSLYNFESRILKQGSRTASQHRVFLPFNEPVRDFIRANAKALSN